MFSYSSLVVACLVVTVNGLPTNVECQSTIEKYPYVVSIEYDSIHVGGGSIISRHYILTAAAVVSEATDLSLLSARTGSSFSNKYGSVHNVCDVKVHDYGIAAYTVAVIRVVQPIVFDARRQPIRLFQYSADSGANVSVSAWPNLFVAGKKRAPLSIFEGIVNKNCVGLKYELFCIGRPFDEDWNVSAGRGHPVVDDGLQTGVLVISDNYSNSTHVADIGYSHDDWVMKTMKEMVNGPCSSDCEGKSK